MSQHLDPKLRDALEVVAHTFGWDRASVTDMGLIAWASFHYYVSRLHASHALQRAAERKTGK